MWVGNAAYEQLQLDLYGEIANAIFQAGKGIAPAKRGRALRPAIVEHLATAWQQPDDGIWEVRGGPQHFVHSKVMAWVAFDRAAKQLAREGLSDAARRWRWIAREIHAEVCRRGFNRQLNSFVQAYGSKQLDASLLLLPLVGFLPASDPRSKRNASSHRTPAANRPRIRLALRYRKGGRRSAGRQGRFFRLRLLARRQLPLAGPACGRTEAF